MCTLWNMMLTEGWIGVMWDAVDASDIYLVPRDASLADSVIESDQWLTVAFFIFFMIVGSLFILNMFVGIVINMFNLEKEAL